MRAELAYPIMITPFAQFVGTQAVMNMISGKRYSVVPNEIKKYALGYYGKLLAPIEPTVLKRILDNGATNIAHDPQPIPDMLPDLRARYPDDSFDHVLLRAMFAGTQVDEMQKAVSSGVVADESATPLLALIRALHAKRDMGRIVIKTADLQISMQKDVEENVG